ncbi:MAG: TraY domain-containing protein [Clostridia bacterium]|nr:TraY domain-containing protein [Clostridia bacterium]
MKDKLPRYTMRIERDLLDKLQYIAKYEGRTANKQLEQLVKRCIREFEKDNGKITEDMIQEMYGNDL